MCASCGCGQINDRHDDSRHITMHDLDQAAQAAQTTREQVVQNMMRATRQTEPSQPIPASSSPVKTSGKRPGEYAPPLGQDSGTDWQESQQMGQTGRGGVENPLRNP